VKTVTLTELTDMPAGTLFSPVINRHAFSIERKGRTETDAKGIRFFLGDFLLPRDNTLDHAGARPYRDVPGAQFFGLPITFVVFDPDDIEILLDRILHRPLDHEISGTVEIRQAGAWTCDRCGKDHFTPVLIREASREEEESRIREAMGLSEFDPVPETTGGFFRAVKREVGCPYCGARYTTKW
jgi:hypothetical protein